MDQSGLVFVRENETMASPEWLTKEFQRLASGGHSRISITQDVYVHTNERQDREAANLAARAILGS